LPTAADSRTEPPGSARSSPDGNVVYGPGKAYLDTIVAGLRSGGRTRVIGDGTNQLPLTSVTDAAAITHLAGTPRTDLVGRSFLAVPPTPVSSGSS
jgi:hypothetical protein